MAATVLLGAYSKVMRRLTNRTRCEWHSETVVASYVSTELEDRESTIELLVTVEGSRAESIDATAADR